MLVPSTSHFLHNAFHLSEKDHTISRATLKLSSAIAFNLDKAKILSSGTGLTHYHTVLHFDALKIYSCGKHCEKRRNCYLQAISPFLTMFSTLYGTYFPFQMHFKMSSAFVSNSTSPKFCLLLKG